MLASEFFPVPSNELCISSVKKEAFNVMDDHKEVHSNLIVLIKEF